MQCRVPHPTTWPPPVGAPCNEGPDCSVHGAGYRPGETPLVHARHASQLHDPWRLGAALVWMATILHIVLYLTLRYAFRAVQVPGHPSTAAVSHRGKPWQRLPAAHAQQHQNIATSSLDASCLLFTTPLPLPVHLDRQVIKPFQALLAPKACCLGTVRSAARWWGRFVGGTSQRGLWRHGAFRRGRTWQGEA